MPSPGSERLARLRALLFAACAACTLWLIVQNTILFALVPHAWAHGAVGGIASAALGALAWSVLLALVPLAFALGWLASGRPRGRANNGERVHE
jgi:hypothetical protein